MYSIGINTLGVNKLGSIGKGISSKYWVTQYLFFSDGEADYREGVRDYCYVLDITITPLGFSGVENTDWENLESVAVLTNVLDFGVYNDGTHRTENVDAINACIDREGIIYFPNGTYAIDWFLVVHGKVSIIGESEENTIIEGYLDYCFIVSDGHDATLDLLMQNFTIKGQHGYDPYNYNTNPQEGAIYIEAAWDHNTEFWELEYQSIILRNITCKDIGGGGIQSKGTLYSLIEDCHVDNCNFVAFTVGYRHQILRRCTSSNTMMFAETVGSLNDSIFDVDDIVATELWIYGIKNYGRGFATYNNVKLSVNPDRDHEIYNTECFGFYFLEPSPIGDVEYQHLTNVEIRYFRVGICCQPTAYLHEEGAVESGPINEIHNVGVTYPETLEPGVKLDWNYSVGVPGRTQARVLSLTE